MISLDIDSRGLGTLGIADAEGKLHDYRLRLAPRGMSLWAVQLTRIDNEASYLVRVFVDGKWDCECPAQKYRKRGHENCKHIQAAAAFRAWLADFLQPTTIEVPYEQRSAG